MYVLFNFVAFPPSCALMLLQRGANCTAEVVTPVRTKEVDKSIWLWKHAIPEPVIPERHTILQVHFIH